jgi:hypothetical protein
MLYTKERRRHYTRGMKAQVDSTPHYTVGACVENEELMFDVLLEYGQGLFFTSSSGCAEVGSCS